MKSIKTAILIDAIHDRLMDKEPESSYFKCGIRVAKRLALEKLKPLILCMS